MWIENLINNLTCFIPRIVIMQPDEGGFRQRVTFKGTKVIELKASNWYFIVPLFMDYLVVKTTTQIKDIRIQSVSTKDGIDLAMGVSLRYYISDPVKAILNVRDFDESIQNVALGVVSDYVEVNTEEYLRLNRQNLKEKILKYVRDESSGFGLKIQAVKITDFGKTNNLRLLMDDRIGFKIESE